MNTDTRLRLDMGARVRGFCRAHPTDDPGYTGLVTRLEDRLDRARILAEQQRAGQVTAHASVVSKDDLKVLVRDRLLVVSGAAELAALDDPGLDARVEAPSLGISHRAFLTAARVVLAQATPLKETLQQHGMPVNFLADLAVQVDHYEQVVDEKVTAQSSHVGASADLEAVAAEVLMVVRMLDRVNRVRFRKDAELLAAWKSARDVAWVNPAEPEVPPATGPAGEETAA
jgi:hypothetical protein